MKRRWFQHRPRRRSLAAASLALLVLLVMWWQASRWYEVRQLGEQRAAILAEVTQQSSLLATAINQRFALLRGLAAFVQINPSLARLEAEFPLFAAGLHAGMRGIRNFAVAPDGVIRLVHPLADNEAALGHDLPNDPHPNVRADVLQAIASRQITLSGPYELLQGGLGLVARLALYEGDTLWGLVTMTLDVPPILEDAGLTTTVHGLDLALRDPTGTVFFGTAAIFADDPVVLRIDLADSYWELASVPSGGWYAARQAGLLAFQIVGLFIVGLITILTYLVINRQARLALAVQLRTHELSRANADLELEVGERQRAEDAARLAKDYAENLIETANVIVVELDAAGNVRVLNRAAEDITGYGRSELEGKNWFEVLVPKERYPHVWEEFNRLLADGLPKRFENPILTKSGEERFITWQNNEVREDGQITGTISFGIDFTERKQAEEKLHASEQRYRTLFEHAPDGILIANAESHYLDANASMCRMLGYTRDELIGLHASDIVAQAEIQYIAPALVVIKAQSEYHREWQFRRKDGSIFAGEVSVTAMPDGNLLALIRDVTERKQVEEALQESEARYRGIFDGVQDAIFVETLDGKILDVNRSACEMYGFSHAELLTKVVADLVPAESPILWFDEDTLDAQPDHPMETVNLRADGSRFPIEISGRLHTLGGEKTLLVVIRDITERKRAEDALRRYAQRLEDLQEIDRAILAAQSPEEIIRAALSRTRRLIHCERAGASMFDYQAGIARSIVVDVDYPLGPPEGTVVPLQDLPPLNASGGEEYVPDLAVLEHRAPIRDRLLAEGIRCTFRVPLVVEGELIGDLYFSSPRPAALTPEHHDIIREVTAQVAVAMQQARLRDQLQRRVAELASLVNVANALRAASTHMAIVRIVIEQAMGLFQAQGAALEVFDPSTGELVAELGVGVWAAVTGVRIPPGEGLSAQIITTGQPYLNNNVRRDPRLFRPDLIGDCQAAAGVPLITEEHIVGLLWIAHTADITTAQLRLLTAVGDIAANALHRANVMDTLEQRVVERTHELAEANARLTELDKLKNKFVSDVSHELRTPVTNLSLYLNLLERGRPEKHAEYLSALHDQTVRLGQLIEDILDLSRLEASWTPTALAPVDLNTIVEQVVTTHRPRAETTGLALVFNAGPNLPPVQAEQNQLVRVVSNLVANAINYTHAGQVTIATRTESSGVVLRVQDTGIGIDPEDIPHLFERFYRGQRTAQSNMPGTGLGLAIVKEIVDRHGGRIEVKSHPTGGSTFYVWLPRSEVRTVYGAD